MWKESVIKGCDNAISHCYSFFRKDVNLKEFTVDTTDLTQYRSEDIRLGMHHLGTILQTGSKLVITEPFLRLPFEVT